MVFGGEQPLLDSKFTERDLENLEVRDLVDHRCVLGHRHNLLC
jgi:hypothetical protein